MEKSSPSIYRDVHGLAQGIAVLQDQMAEIPLVNFLGLKIVSIESYSSYIII